MDNDITPPSVSFTLDQTASDIKGTFAAAITATDNNAVEKVELFVDNVLQGTDTTAAYAVSVDSTSLSNGSHVVKVVATDSAGNTAYQEMDITVNKRAGFLRCGRCITIKLFQARTLSSSTVWTAGHSAAIPERK